MKGKALAAQALVVTALAASAFGAGYIERFDFDRAEFTGYGDGTHENIWIATGGSTGGTTEGHIYAGDADRNIMISRRQNTSDPVEPWDTFAGPHPGEALVMDIKGQLPSYKRGIHIRMETSGLDALHAWMAVMAFQGGSPVAIGSGDEWVRCIVPLNVDAVIPVDLTGGAGTGELSWSAYTKEEDYENGTAQDDLLFTVENTIRFVIEHPGRDTFIDNVGFTYSGDANGDGTVGIADLVALAENYGANDPNTVGWTQGDFNTDFQVGIADLVALAENYGRKTGDLIPPPLVPEPVTLLLIVGGATALLRRRR